MELDALQDWSLDFDIPKKKCCQYLTQYYMIETECRVRAIPAGKLIMLAIISPPSTALILISLDDLLLF